MITEKLGFKVKDAMGIKGTQLEFCYYCPGLYVLFPLKVCLSFWWEKLIGTKPLILSTTNITVQGGVKI